MEDASLHEIELYPPESFKTLLEHEVNMSRRYGNSLTLIDFIVETVPATAETRHSAEVFAINVLNLHLRDTDIPCQKGSEFLILMPSTAPHGARTACERIKQLMTLKHHTLDRVSFQMSAYIGMATLPMDRALSSDVFTEHASQALQYARSKRLTSVVSFSEIST